MDADSKGTWRKSSYSGTNGGGCVEVADGIAGVPVGDTTDRDGGTLRSGAGARTRFTAGLK